MITVITRPYDGQTLKYNPVYNGLPFVVSSEQKDAGSMRYVAEIYTGDAPGYKIGELRHNPDISYNNYGVFDVGRVIEDYITYQLPYDQTGVQLASSAWKKYYVSFGEELNRTVKISAYSSILGSGAVTSFGIASPTIFSTDLSRASVLIQGTSKTEWNKAWKVAPTPSGTYTISIATPWVGGVSVTGGYMVHGFWVSGLTSYVGADGMSYYQFTVKGTGSSRNKANPFFASVGDTIVTYPNSATDTNVTFLNGTSWNINEIVVAPSSPNPSLPNNFTFKTNIPYQTDISYAEIHFFPQNPAVKRDLFMTSNDQAVAWNGVFQYEDFRYYSPNQWVMNATTSKFLTKRPRKEIKVCATDYFTLSSLGNYGVAGGQWTGLIVEGTSTLTYAPLSTTSAVQNASAFEAQYAGRTLLTFNGAHELSYSNGSYVTMAGYLQETGPSGTIILPTSTSTRVINSYFNDVVNKTYIVIDVAYNSSFVCSASYPWTLTMTKKIVMGSIGFNYIGVPSTTNTTATIRPDWCVGPKNLVQAGYSDWASTISSYTVAPYRATTTFSGVYRKWEKCGETITFKIDCPCEARYKKYTLAWLNELGGFDYYDFTLRTDKKRDITRDRFRRKLKSVQDSGKYSYKNGERGLTTYDVDSRETWTLRTDWLDQDTIDWIQYIYESPEVYIIDNSYKTDFGIKSLLIPVSIADESVELLNKNNWGEASGGLKIYEITALKSNNRNVQRGSNFGGAYFYNRA